MKPMIAFRQQPSFLAGDKVGETNSTFQSIFEVFGIDDHYGNGFENLWIETAAEGGGGIGQFEVAGGEVEAAAPPCGGGGGGGGGGFFFAVVPKPFGVEVEKEREDYDQEEEYYTYHHEDLPCELNST